jgi:hypothetical protein
VSAALAAAVLATARLATSHAYADGAPPGFSGGFKEESCHACHFHAPPNAPPGRVVVDGVPATFAPGARYTLTVTLTRPAMKRAGFQLAARFSDSGAQAGTLAPGAEEEPRVRVDSQAGVQYAVQKVAGSAVADTGIARWRIEWTAPERGGQVVFNASANAADGNDSADGDFVYTTIAESAPHIPGDARDYPPGGGVTLVATGLPVRIHRWLRRPNEPVPPTTSSRHASRRAQTHR